MYPQAQLFSVCTTDKLWITEHLWTLLNTYVHLILRTYFFSSEELLCILLSISLSKQSRKYHTVSDHDVATHCWRIECWISPSSLFMDSSSHLFFLTSHSSLSTSACSVQGHMKESKTYTTVMVLVWLILMCNPTVGQFVELQHYYVSLLIWSKVSHWEVQGVQGVLIRPMIRLCPTIFHGTWILPKCDGIYSV